MMHNTIIEKTITALKEKIDLYQEELEDLHLHEPTEEYYKLRKNELEHQIANIELAIYELEQTFVVERTKAIKFIGSVLLAIIFASLLYFIVTC
jgi:hypothetical protein